MAADRTRSRTKGSRNRLRSLLLGVGLLAFGLIAWVTRGQVPAAHGHGGAARESMKGSNGVKSGYVANPDEPLEVRGTIFASIISYRDSDCAGTIETMFDKADYPERVFAGICEQNMEALGSGEDCSLAHLPVRLRSNVGYARINASDAKGIPLARHLAASKFNGQDFFMQIDAHSMFRAGWDTLAVGMMQRLCKCNPKPVLSHYPLAWGDEKNPRVPRICDGSFTNSGIFRFNAAHEYSANKNFVRVPFAAGGFMFFPGQVINEMPHDPHLPYLFDGDEVLWSIRLFTHGWDVYTPTANIIWHRYKGGKNKAEKRPGDVFQDHSGKYQWLQDQATLKVRWMLGSTDEKPSEIVLKDFERHKLGSDRPLSAWEEFAQVDLKNQSGNPKDKFCGDNVPDKPDRVCPGLL